MTRIGIALVFVVFLGAIQDQAPTRDKILQLQNTYEKNWKQFLARSSDMIPYLKEWREAVGDQYEKEITTDELLESILKKKVVFVGDHHTNTSIHQLQAQLFQKIQNKAKKSITLGVEYTTAKSTVAAAKKLGWGVISMESGSEKAIGTREFPERDKEIAATTDKFAKEHPDRLLVVVYGEAHLIGKNHAVDLTAADKAVVLTISDWVYWTLALKKESLDLEGTVLKIREDVYYAITGDPVTRLAPRRSGR